MARERTLDPMARVRTYIARRSGMADPIVERRRIRRIERGRSAAGEGDRPVGVQVVEGAPTCNEETHGLFYLDVRQNADDRLLFCRRLGNNTYQMTVVAVTAA